MKISLFSLPEIAAGKRNIKDTRLDQVDKIVKAKKKTYIQIELVGQEDALEADSIMVLNDNRADLILNDLEFVETRTARSSADTEKALLNKLKDSLEKEKFINSISLTQEEILAMSSYNLFTNKPVVIVEKNDLDNQDELLSRAVRESGFISFFTAGEKETRAWLIKKGITAWEASGTIHSDIQKGFIRAEIISLEDFLSLGGETPAKQAGKMRLEQKDYIMQDCDLANFRFNK